MYTDTHGGSTGYPRYCGISFQVGQVKLLHCCICVLFCFDGLFIDPLFIPLVNKRNFQTYVIKPASPPLLVDLDSKPNAAQRIPGHPKRHGIKNAICRDNRAIRI